MRINYHYNNLLTILILSLLIISCDGTLLDSVLPPGQRDYSWEVDTLEYFGWHATSMWGTSENNVWVAGDGWDTEARIWNFNGTNWGYNKEGFGIIGPVFGFSENEVWAAGGEGRIYHLEDNEWKVQYTYKNNNACYTLIQDIWGVNRFNLMAVGLIYTDKGWRGFILKYNGYDWNEIYVADFNSYFFRILSNKNSTSIYYIWAFNDPIYPCGEEPQPGDDSVSIYKFSGESILELYKKPESEIPDTYIATLSLVGNEIYFTEGNQIFKLVGDSFVPFLKVNLPGFYSYVTGRHSNDLFLIMEDGVVHYNGIDMQYLFKLGDNFSMTSGQFFTNNAAFFQAGTFPTVVYRGYLK